MEGGSAFTNGKLDEVWANHRRLEVIGGTDMLRGEVKMNTAGLAYCPLTHN